MRVRLQQLTVLLHPQAHRTPNGFPHILLGSNTMPILDVAARVIAVTSISNYGFTDNTKIKQREKYSLKTRVSSANASNA